MSDETKRYTVLPRTLVLVFKGAKLLMMKYSGKGEHMTSEKVERKDIYNAVGGHIEQDEDVIENATKEAREEAGVRITQTKIRGIVNVSNFAGKNIMMFVVTGNTEDEPLKSTLEGELEWIDADKIESLNVFSDIKPILTKLGELKEGEMFIGKSEFDGKFGLLKIDLRVI